MMGRTHVLVAGIAGLYVAEVSNLNGTGGVLLFAAVVGGAGELCDLDHPSASPARAFFWPARMASYGVRRLAGGHRGATHSLLFAGAATLMADQSENVAWGEAVVVGVLVAMGLYVALPMGTYRRPVAFIAGVLVARWVEGDHVVSGAQLALALAVGIGTHLVCDTCTDGGVPWLWPLRSRLALPLIGRRGSWREHLLGLTCLLWLTLLLVRLG